ncbi:hypothetical protein OPV22_030951 [Ensete ventricosum]|uniref:phosphopantothenoylcysteine decarboxylase n=1 Tax=Ensete ventricosum TaxID=4639 RepID=A0AAV8PT95_ENSVE|nr:hypothetical protein OPV22_030951 [Ensete ventricosum]
MSEITDFHILSKASREVSKFATIALVDLVPKRLLVDVESEDLVEGVADDAVHFACPRQHQQKEATHLSQTKRHHHILLLLLVRLGREAVLVQKWKEIFPKVRAVATKSSLHFLDKASFPRDVILYTDDDEWSSWKKIGDGVLHIELRKWADIMVIAPLSANTLAKIAGGLCDNLLTCIVRAWDYSKPIFVAPAMNTLMWNNPFTKRHLDAINELGVNLIPPVTKRLACGDYGNVVLQFFLFGQQEPQEDNVLWI